MAGILNLTTSKGSGGQKLGCIPNCGTSKRFKGHKPRRSPGRWRHRRKPGTAIWIAPKTGP